jgi:hypothetical protein
MSGNVGDTLSVMPVLSGIYKSTGHKISLVVRDKMKMFLGIKEFMEMQDCIAAFKFQSDVKLDDTYNPLGLVDNFTQHPTRPWETVRLEEFIRKNYDFKFEVDDDFVFKVPPITDYQIDDRYFIVGDRMNHPEMDKRRSLETLKGSNKFRVDRSYFLDYNVPMAVNAAYLKRTDKPIFSTFTGLSTVADLLNKETIVLWGDDLANWDNKPIEYSFNKHFYRDRKCKLQYIGDFNLQDYEELLV